MVPTVSRYFFEKLSYTNRKELIKYYAGAKKESTRDKRLALIKKLLANKLKLEEKKLLN
ncbi:MAG: YdeI/OmpD-associated family protein [Flavobacteriaceae bacterium]